MYIRLGFNIVNIVCELIGLFELLIILRAVLSWFASPYGTCMSLLTRTTEPVIRPVRNVMTRLIGSWQIDFSPAVTIILLDLLKNLIVRLL